MSASDAILKSLMDLPEAHLLINHAQKMLQAEQKRREDFYDWVTADVRAEFINGEVIVHSPVRSRHAQASDNAFRICSLYVMKHQLGRVTHEKVMARFTRNDYEPDVMFFGKEKAASIEPTQALFPVPDFVIEVVSDSTEARDRGIKYNDYAAHGVAEYWILDVDNATIEQYLLQDDQYFLNLKTNEGTIYCQQIKDLVVPVSALFDEKENFDFVQQLFS
jgi:Uma2 family endonuclease